MNGEKPVAKAELSTADKLAFERTRLAYERTTMAWIRTAAALITFGFGMYKLFEFMPLIMGKRPGEQIISSREFALVLAGLGNFCLLLAAIHHRRSLQMMRSVGVKVPRSGAAILALLLSLMGIGVLVILVFRM
jgi:putative membrane protein